MKYSRSLAVLLVGILLVASLLTMQKALGGVQAVGWPDPVHLPLVWKDFASLPTYTKTPTFTPTFTATSTSSSNMIPQPGQWSGFTSRAHPVHFTVSGDSTQWSNFALTTDFFAGSCAVFSTLEITSPGPGSITNNGMSLTSGDFAFTGHFNTSTAATGTYSFNNYRIVLSLSVPPYVCITFLTQSGTWTASPP